MLTAEQLARAAAAYVARYDASSARLRAVLMRRVMKARRKAMPVMEGVEVAVDRIVGQFISKGIIDDARYAERKAGSLHRRGVSTRHIREKLKLAGIGGDTADRALQATREDAAPAGLDLDLQAAVVLARRRRLGPFREAAERADRRARDLAALGRAGFAYDVARRVIDAEDAESLLMRDVAT
jgi:regulatory protein